MSVKSYASSRMSGASNLSKKSLKAGEARPGLQAAGAQAALEVSDTESQLSHVHTQYSNLNEEDEWTAIQNFNTILHYEEQKQMLMRERERKRLIREELDRQVREKRARKRKEREEEDLYDHLQRKHAELVDEKEREREAEARAKAAREKASRDQQLKDEKRRRKHNDRETRAQEQAIVARLKDEMRQERDMYMEKRRQEREYLQAMLTENEKRKAHQANQRDRERAEDVAAQEAYTAMLKQQEDDRQAEFERREKRAQEFMGRMADTVLKEMDARQRDEDEKVRQYEMEREMQERLNDQLQFQRHKDEQKRMRDTLARQVAEKKRRERMEKDFNDEQARMWKMDRELFEKQEAELNDKIKSVNMENR